MIRQEGNPESLPMLEANKGKSRMFRAFLGFDANDNASMEEYIEALREGANEAGVLQQDSHKVLGHHLNVSIGSGIFRDQAFVEEPLGIAALVFSIRLIGHQLGTDGTNPNTVLAISERLEALTAVEDSHQPVVHEAVTAWINDGSHMGIPTA